MLLTSLRPGALERLGLGADAVRERYPKLIYARGNGFGVNGPDADQPGYDSSAFWARGGVGHMLTPPDRDYPISQRGAMGDRNGAMALAFGIAAALLKRTRTGEGSVVDVSLLATAMWMLSSDLLAALNDGDGPCGLRVAARVVSPLTATYRTKDDRHVQLMFLQGDRYWPEFCRTVGRAELADDARFADMAARRANAAACVAELDAVFAEPHAGRVEGRSSRRWTRRGRRSSRSRKWSTTHRSRQLVHRRGRDRRRCESYRLPTVPVQFDGQPPELRRAPEHGEHTEAVLTELGYDWDRIGQLADEGVIP